MPVKFDPVDIVYSAGTSVVLRVLAFFVVGWGGMTAARVGYQIDHLSDLKEPLQVVERTFEPLPYELLAGVAWPLHVMFAASGLWGALYLSIIIILFAVICFSEVDFFRSLILIVVLQGTSSLLCHDAEWISWLMMASFIVSVVGAAYFIHWWQQDEMDEEV